MISPMPFVIGATDVNPQPKPTYRVIGVRDDGSRIQIDDRLSVGRANDILVRLSVANAFDHVIVELEPIDLDGGRIRNSLRRAERALDESDYNSHDTAESS